MTGFSPPTTESSSRPMHRDLTAALERASIPYVYWKPTAGVIRAMSGGRKDLDLLVSPSSLESARRTLQQHGYKRFVLPRGALPGSEAWVGWDRLADRFYYAHLHWELHTGRPGLHEQELPWVEPLLSFARPGPAGASVLCPEAELALVATRAVFEPRLWSHSPHRISGDACAMIEASRRASDARQLAVVSSRLFGTAGRRACELLSEPRFPMEQAAWSSWRTLVRRALSRSRVSSAEVTARWTLAHARSLGAVAVRRTLGVAAGELLPRPSSNKLRRRGGFLLAFIGPDGAGKSTLTHAIVGWLAELFATESLYLGRGEWVSRAQQAAAELKWAVVERVTDRERPTDSGPADDDGRRHRDAPARQQRVRWVRDASAVALAERKLRAMRRADGLRRRGWVLVTDRFPHPTERLCDGPAIVLGVGDPAARRALASVERALYSRVVRTKPDLVVRLLLPVEESLRRKPDHRDVDIRAKLAAARRAQYDATTIDLAADAPLDTVLDAVKAAVWERL